MTSRLIIFVDVPLIEARTPTAPQPASAVMLYRTTERTVRGERWCYYAGTPPRYIFVVTQGFTVSDIAVGSSYDANVSLVTASQAVDLPAYAGRSYTKVMLRGVTDSSIGSLQRLSVIIQKASDGGASPIQAEKSANQRFDPNLIAADTLGRLLEHYSRAESLLGWPNVRFVTDDIARGRLQDGIDLLCRVANGEIERSKANRRITAQVEDMIDEVMSLLWERPYVAAPHLSQVPKEFWQTHIGQVIGMCQKWLHGPYWISYREASKLLYGHAARAAFNRINRLVDEGKLTRFEDPDEPNPQKAGRFDRRDIARLMNAMTHD